MITIHTRERNVSDIESFTCKCSDKPGQHDFNLLKKLVLPDGSILRAKLPGRPTRDCLFSDPARDGKRYHEKNLRIKHFSLPQYIFSCSLNLSCDILQSSKDLEFE